MIKSLSMFVLLFFLFIIPSKSYYQVTWDLSCNCCFLPYLKQEEGVEITANSLHPGAIVTNLLRHHSFIGGKTLSHLTCIQFCLKTYVHIYCK